MIIPIEPDEQEIQTRSYYDDSSCINNNWNWSNSNTTSTTIIWWNAGVHVGPKAPIATSGDNIYIAWWTNKTGNDEVMFRASTDGGKTFGDKINLSNSPKAESQDAHIDASGDRVFVTWWERNATSEEPLLRTSNEMEIRLGR